MEFPDLCAQIRICREKGVMVALDNTWGAGLAFAPFDVLGDGTCGADVSIHALTKYPSGGGDVLMGSVTTRDAAIHAALQRTHMHWGLGVGVNDVEAILRGLPSMAVRYQAQDHSARVLAAWLGQQKGVVQVLHPALEGAPGHAHWKQVCTSSAAPQGLAAGIFTVVLDANYRPEQVDAFCDALRLFRLGYSWGGPVSLVVPYTPDAMRSLPAPHIKPGYWVRFAMGLEATCDLQEDVRQAMRVAFSNE
jgi:cystathionine beta-lyase